MAGSALKENTSMSNPDYLRDKYGNIVGQIWAGGSRCMLRDKYGNLLGWYDHETNWTRDRYGNPVGRDNLLTTLLESLLLPTWPVPALPKPTRPFQAAPLER
jgi:hypothetical protein